MSTSRPSNALAWFLAACIVLVGAILRFVDLDTNPPGLWQDEASTGLDAYLIWTTGRDRANALFPIISRSFGDYPLAGYRYLTAPIVGLFGLTIGNERLLAAITGTMMVIVTGLVARRAFGPRVGLFALASAAFCPTWLHFSRYGSEAILLPFSLIGAFGLFELAKERRWALYPAATMLAFSAYTYHAVKLILPLWTLAFLIYQWPFIKQLWREERRHLFATVILFAALVAPSVHAAVTAGGMARGRTVLAWYHYDGWRLIRVILNNYLNYFDLAMLFVRGGPAVAQSIPGIGLWNLIELPFILIGLFTIGQGGPQRRLLVFVAFWFVLGPLPGGVTYEAQNIGRVIAWLPAPQIISGIGTARVIGWAIDKDHRDRLRASRAVFLAIFLIGWIATAGQVVYLTLVRYPATTERDWQFEISRAMLCAKDKRVDEQLVVSPNFQASEVFARFHYWDLNPDEDGRPQWVFGNRNRVEPGELYVTPRTKNLPIGKMVCEIKNSSTNETRAYVFAGLPETRVVGPTQPMVKPLPRPKLGITPRPKPLQPVKLTATSTTEK